MGIATYKRVLQESGTNLTRSKTMQLILKTLAISTLAMAAFGADNKLTFRVDFPFSVGKTEMPAGDYLIMDGEAQRLSFQIVNVEAKKSVFVTLPNFTQRDAADGKRSIEFRCGDGGCEISNVKNLRSGYVFHSWTAKKPNMRTIAIALKVAENKAD